MIDTLEDLTDSVNYALELHNFHKRRIEEIRRFVGNGVGRLIELSVPNGRNNPFYEKCLDEFRAHYSKNMQNKTAPYKGIPELLKQLKKDNYKLAVVSNKFDKAVKGLVKEFFGEYIQVAIGESEYISRKPAPDILLKALEELETFPDKAVFVGDSEVDVKTAKNSGIKCVGVTWGFRDREILEGEGADYIINEPIELMKIIAPN